MAASILLTKAGEVVNSRTMKAGGALVFANDARLFIQATGMTAAQIQFPEDGRWEGYGSYINIWKNIGIDLYVHAPFRLNPCDPKRLGWYLKNLRNCLSFADAVGAKGVVLHPGSRGEETEDMAKTYLLEFIRRVKMKWEGLLLLETDAGSKKGTRVGSLDFLVKVCEDWDGHPVRLADEPIETSVKICLDTAHLYARGVDMWDNTVRDALVMAGVYDWVGLVHLNVPDPEVGLGSSLDRHNTAFKDYSRPSSAMICDLVRKFPVILERSSLEHQRLDMLSIRLALGSEQGIP